MFWLVAIFSAIAGLVGLYGLILIARGILGESVRLRRRSGGSNASQKRRWVLFASGAGLVAAALVFVIVALQQVVIIEPDITFSSSVTAVTVGVGLAGAVWLVRCLIGDRAKGRRRCPKCWHSLEGTPGLRCPECGYESDSERALLRSRRSKLAIALALLLSLAAPLGLAGQAYLSQHPSEDLWPVWALHRGMHLPRRDTIRSQAGQLLYERIQYGGMKSPDVKRTRDRFMQEMLGNANACWDHAHWMILMACVNRTEYEMTLDEWAGLHAQLNTSAWQRLADPDLLVREENATVWTLASHVLGPQNMWLRYDRGRSREFVEACDAFTQILIDNAPPNRNPVIAENLTSGNQMLVLSTLDLFAGHAAAPYAEELFALFDEPTEREGAAAQYAGPAARALRKTFSEDPGLMQRFWTCFDMTKAADVQFVAKMLSWPMSYSGDLRRWEFPGSHDWLVQQLESGPIEACQSVVLALLSRPDMLPLVLDIAIPRMRAHPDQARFLIPDTAGLDEQERELWCERLMWLAKEGTPDAKFTLGWVLVRIGRENPALRDKADSMVRAMGLEPPETYEGPEGVNYLYVLKEPAVQEP